MIERLKKKDYFWGLALVGGVAIAGLLLGLQEFATQSDLATRQREQTVVLNGFAARVAEVEAQSVTNSVWDEAVRHLDNKFDPEWAKENIGDYFLNNGNFQFSYVLDHKDQAVFAMTGDDVSPLSTFSEIAPNVDQIVRNVRARERLRQWRGTTDGETLRNPIQFSAPMWLDNRFYIVTATLVQSDFDHAAIKQARAPIVMTGRELDSSFMDLFGKRYLLNNIHVHEGDSRSEPDEAHAPIFDLAGNEIATLDWTAQTPGADLSNRFRPWVAGFIAALVALILALYVLGRRQATKARLAEAQTKFLAYHDSLTTLPNRAYLEQAIADRLKSQPDQILALHCFNLANFKDVNDTHGISVGDELLKAVSLRLATACGSLARVFRIGGDEFAILQSINASAEVDALSDRVLQLLSAPFMLSIGSKRIGACSGVALSRSDVFSPQELMRRANLALFQAKAAGEGTHLTFEDRMDEELHQKNLLKEDLRCALANNSLHMVYQPQVRLNGEIVGLEALMRWTHPEKGPISPAIFIPLAEEAGLIKDIGDFALRQAAQDSRSWNHIKVAVNVSATQLQEFAFVDRVKAIIATAGADLHDIEIELTEGVLLSNNEDTRSTLMALHDAGFTIALDDFGTGYSSLSYLQNFPIDKLKIDRAFVQNLGLDPKADALFTAIVRLAQALNMRVIAEGVETDDQWLRLTHAGCPKIQGFIASRPLPANDVQPFIDAWRSQQSISDAQPNVMERMSARAAR